MDLDNILVDQKSNENILLYNISYKSLIAVEPLCIKFNKIDEFNRVYDGTSYLALFRREKYDFIFNKIRYLIGGKSGITYVISQNYAKISRFIRCFTSRKSNNIRL